MMMVRLISSLLRILALTRKELLAVLKDPRARVSLLIPPILQSLIFGYAATYDLNHVPYAVLDQDRSAASAELLADMQGNKVFQKIGDLRRVADIRGLIDSKKALIVIQVPQGFERGLQSGKGADVQVIADGRNSNTAGVAGAYVGAIVEQFNENWRSDHAQPGPPVQMVARAWYNPNLESRWNMIPGMIGTLTLLQTMLLTTMSVAREREQGTFDQLLVTPLSPSEIMIGKAFPCMLIGLSQATGVLLVAQLWFRIPFAGSVLTLYAGLIFFLLAAIGIGLLLSSFAATQQQAMLYGLLLIMPFSLLSGLTTPLSNMPLALQYFTAINPLRYAIDITQRVYLEGAGLDRLGQDLIPLTLISAVTLVGGAWMFRQRLQ
jgi:ABC-2 type transport system permease protein